jgi:hypothetical protein
MALSVEYFFNINSPGFFYTIHLIQSKHLLLF